MKYFLDTEFLEGTQKGLLKETKPTIDLISIGIKCEDGREYHAISKEFNVKEAWNRYELVRDGFRDCGLTPYFKKVYWLRDNVCKNIFNNSIYHNYTEINTLNELKNLVCHFGKSNKQIAKEVIEFTCESNINKGRKPEFYGYYADYDWVVFCWLFGRMIDLPEGFPMYCIDLKQELDNKADRLRLPNTELSKEQMIETIKSTANYPKQTNEHNALSDARWNYELYKFLNKI